MHPESLFSQPLYPGPISRNDGSSLDRYQQWEVWNNVLNLFRTCSAVCGPHYRGDYGNSLVNTVITVGRTEVRVKVWNDASKYAGEQVRGI